MLYFAREHKGHEGIKRSPAEDFQGGMIHDHDVTFYSYERFRQECLEHVLRYLKNSMDNEPGLKWNQQMRELIREMIRFRNSLDPDERRNPDEADPKKVEKFEARLVRVSKVHSRKTVRHFAQSLGISREFSKIAELPNAYNSTALELFRRTELAYVNNYLCILTKRVFENGF